jgi:hypothetical protein
MLQKLSIAIQDIIIIDNYAKSKSRVCLTTIIPSAFEPDDEDPLILEFEVPKGEGKKFLLERLNLVV